MAGIHQPTASMGTQTQLDYRRIEQAIHYIRTRQDAQPTLAEVAEHVHLSEFHFQRLFTRWAGVSPKRFLQVLTLQRAKSMLASTHCSILEAADLSGLSSASRLYDHFVQIEAVTPSEFKQRGAGLTLHHAVHPTPFGAAFIALSSRGICTLQFIEDDDPTKCLEQLQAQWPMARLLADDGSHTAAVMAAVFNAQCRTDRPLTLWLRGTNFQINVWKALLQIPQGSALSYRQLAGRIQRPTAARAVGQAVGANPVAFLIPCHRVVRGDGALGGYRWGEQRKAAMQSWELLQAAPH